jgi:hypothetical protein
MLHSAPNVEAGLNDTTANGAFYMAAPRYFHFTIGLSSEEMIGNNDVPTLPLGWHISNEALDVMSRHADTLDNKQLFLLLNKLSTDSAFHPLQKEKEVYTHLYGDMLLNYCHIPHSH